MKLRYSYKLNTWARDVRRDTQNSLTRAINNYEVEFNFDDNHKVVEMKIFIPNVKVKLNQRQTVDASLDSEKEVEAHIIANYIANVLHVQTGRCEATRVGSPDYVPETEEDRRELISKRFTRTRSISMNANISGPTNLSQEALMRYINEKDALSMYVDAGKMSNPTGRYREYFRVIEHFFPYEGKKFDTTVHNYLSRFDPRYTEDFVHELKDLRNRCSHAKRHRDYITSNDVKGMKELRDKMTDLIRIAKWLLDNPPP